MEMNLSELSTIVTAVIFSLGGGGAIVLGLSSWIGKMFADRYLERAKHEIQQEIESYKTKLKKSEFLFQREFEAASQFISLHHGLLPRYRFPEMEREDACRDFACDFDRIEKKLEQYRATHGAALQQDALDPLSKAIDLVASGKFQVRRVDEMPEVLDEGIDLADEAMKELEEVEKELRKVVWLQSST